MKMIWSDKADTDMRDIYDFYFVKSTRVAIDMWDRIMEEADILLTQPYIGPVDLSLGYFEFSVRSLVICSGRFRLYYLIDEEVIYILRVWPCMQDPHKLTMS